MEADAGMPGEPRGSAEQWPDGRAGSETNADAAPVASQVRPEPGADDGPLAPSMHSVPAHSPPFLLLGLCLEPHDH